MEVGSLRGQGWAIPEKDKIKYVYFGVGSSEMRQTYGFQNGYHIIAIGVSNTACKDEFRQNIDLTAGVYFHFYNKHVIPNPTIRVTT